MSDAPTRRQRAIETAGTVDEAGRLHLDAPLEGAAPQAVRVILLFEEEGAEISEQAWLRAASQNPAFDFLSDPEEDIYTAADGVPFEEEVDEEADREA